MNLRTLAFAICATVAAVAAVAVAGCGGDGSTTTVTDHETTTAFLPGTGESAGAAGAAGAAGSGSGSAGGSQGSSGNALAFAMGEFFYKPAEASVAAGPVTIDVDNTGSTTHEWVLAKTDLDPSKLPTLPNGEVDEDKLDSPGEIPDVAAGAKGTIDLTLDPGKYVYFCNLPGHYAGGMYGSLDVTQ